MESPIYLQQLPPNIYTYANEYFKEQLENLYYPDLYILPLTEEGEQQRKGKNEFEYLKHLVIKL